MGAEFSRYGGRRIVLGLGDLLIPDARRGVSADTALGLARFFGTTPESWLNLQQSHDPKLALKAQKGRITRTVRPRARLGEASLRRPRAGAGEPVAPS